MAQAKACYAFWNNDANWSTAAATDGKIGPGDTVHIVGVINVTGPAPTTANQLFWRGSGTPGNPITLKFDAGGQIRHPTGFSTGLIYSAGGLHDVIIEGGNGSVAMNTGAFIQKDIEIYANGTNLANQVEPTSCIILTGTGNNITIKNMYMFGAYQRARNHTSDSVGDGNIASIRGGSNLVFDNNRAEFGEGGLGLTAQTNTTGFRITNNYVYACSTGLKMGTNDGIFNSGAVITGNVVDGFSYWAGIPSPGQHHCDGFQTITPGDDAMTLGNGEHRNYTIAYNRIGPDLGLYGSMNAHIFLEDNVNGMFIYNNILLADSTPLNPAEGNKPPGTANGFITGGSRYTYWGDPNGIKSLIANNTIIGAGRGQGINSGFATIRGNIIQNVDSMFSIWQDQPDNALNGVYFDSDRNVFYSPIGQYQFGIAFGPIYNNFAAWQGSKAGRDSNSVTANPLVTFPTGVITSASSPAINRAPTQTIFTNDFYGAIRTGSWDAGAAEFAADTPAPPTVVSSSINAAGTQFAIVMSEAVAFGTGGTGGMSVTSAGGTVTLGAHSISGSTITWPITNRLIGQGESLTRTYAQPGNGIEATDDGQDLASFSGSFITNNSTVAQAALPVFAPAPGGYSSTQNVTITLTPPGTPGATIRYTTNGTDPTSSTGTLYAGAIPTSLSTTYKARSFAGGFLDSLVATGAYTIGDFVIGNAWTNVAVANQTGAFTWTFRATSSTSPNDAVLGLANKTVAAYADLAVIPRFASSGRIDAWNGAAGDYAAVNTFPYVAGQAYDFVVTVNVPAHTYSMTVVQAGGSTPTTIATNYTFRSSQATVPNLNNFGAIATAGGVTVSNMILSQIGTAISMTGIATNTAGTQVTVTFNSQPSFGTGGQGGFTLSASGGAVTASFHSIGTNAITWTLSRVIGRGETVSATYVQPGNGIEAASGGSDLASFAGQSTVNNSTVDLTAPTPNPSTFGISPTALTSSTITMTATTSTDAGTPPVQYFFNEVSGNAGGSDSGWQSSPTFLDAGLAAGTQYRYRVQTRDSAVPPNVTTFSQEFSATTKSVAGARPAQPFNMARANIVTP